MHNHNMTLYSCGTCCTVNPPNSGHIGDRPFVRYSEVGRSQRFWSSRVFEMTYEKKRCGLFAAIKFVQLAIALVYSTVVSSLIDSIGNATGELSYVRGYMDSWTL